MAHFIHTDLLNEGVTENLRQVASYAAKHEACFMKLLIERFMELSADFKVEQMELKEYAAVLQGEFSRALETTANAEKSMKVIRRHTSFEELTPTLLREFVEK